MMLISKSTAIASALIAAVFLAALPHESAAQPAPPPPTASAPSPGIDCFPYLINVSDCLSFVERGSNLTAPDKGCCPELSQLVDAQPVCLCQLLGHPAQVGIPLDISRALKLPSACNVSIPPVSLCAGFGVPVADLAPTPSQGIGVLVGSPAPSELSADGESAAEAASPSQTSADAVNNIATPASLPSHLFPLAPLLLTYCFF